MNNLKIAIPPLVAMTILILMCLTSAKAHNNPAATREYNPSIPAFSESLIKQRLENLSTVIDIQYTPEVGKRIKEYTVSYRIAGERILGKVDLYFPLFSREIAKRKLPQELKYISVVESNLNPYAKSKSGASGLWQFIKSTAKLKGLRVDDKLDERRSPEKSTEAALDYLTELYEIFGDWTLTIAAYNCGPGGVKKAIRKSGGKNKYWEIRKFLPKETQKYVPRVIAAMYLMQYYHAHNLTPRQVDRQLSQVIEINDNKEHNFKTLAEDLNVDIKILMNLNPQFRTGYYKDYDGSQVLVIPYNRYDTYLEKYDYENYKRLLVKRRELEIELRKDEIKLRPLIKPLQPIESLIFKKVRHQRKKTVYKATMSKWNA